MINWTTITLEDLAGYISEELRKRDIDAILVGGACVTIYSKNRYQSYGLDFITYDDMRKVKSALLEGFSKKHKHYQHPECNWYIEFVFPPVAIGGEPVRDFNEIKTFLGTIKLLRPTDSVKDRLAAFYHWDDNQALEQAIGIYREQDIKLEEVENWSKKNQLEKFKIFKRKLNTKQR
jgi:hypothetical protein